MSEPISDDEIKRVRVSVSSGTHWTDSQARTVNALLDEVERLRAENVKVEAENDQLRSSQDATDVEVERLRAEEIAGGQTVLELMAKIKRLQAELALNVTIAVESTATLAKAVAALSRRIDAHKKELSMDCFCQECVANRQTLKEIGE